MRNSEVARAFDELADILELQNENPFRVRAYRNAARMIDTLQENLADILADPGRQLEELPGIGKDLAQKIRTLLETGTLPQLEDLRKQVPASLMELLRLPGMGPKKAAALFHELNIQSLADLKQAAEQGKVAKLKGFGKKTEQSILEGITQLETMPAQRVYLAQAKPVAEAIVQDLLKSGTVNESAVAGSCRRCKETVGDLDVLATSDTPEDAMDRLAHHPMVEKVLARGETKQRVRLNMGLELDLRVVPDESYGAAMVYFTGSKEHNIILRQRALKRGLKINEYGVYRGEKLVAGKTEEDVYQAVDLPWIPPELRENRNEFELAEEGCLPKLVELKDMKGDLHMHTTASDGTASIREMVEAAKERGLKYIAITDHSKRVTMAHGLDADRLRKHWNEIDKVRGKVSGIEVLRGVECDILEDATMDLEDDVLREADWVIAVLHYGLRQPREQINKRLLAAIQNPYVSVIGHCSGRIIGNRPGADIDYERIFRAAAEHGVMMEINADPARLDLDDLRAAAAHDHGIPIVISTDSHSTKGFDSMRYGVCQARRAGLTKKDVANTRPWSQFRKLLRKPV